MTISSLKRETGLGMTTVRRMWYGTSDGSEEGSPLQYVQLQVLDKIARVLDVEPCDLLVREE